MNGSGNARWIAVVFSAWKDIAWWFLAPLKLTSLVLAIIADGAVVLVVGIVLALFAGWIPQSVIDAEVARAGTMVETAVMPHLPHLHAAIPQASPHPQGESSSQKGKPGE